VDTLLVKGRVPWTLKHHGSDAGHTGKAHNFKPIDYPPFEEPLSTDLMTSVSLTGTNHAEDQPVHLLVRKPEEQTEATARRTEHVRRNVEEFGGLLGRACPAGVYEYVDVEGGAGADDGSWNGKKLVINSQNCIHCKLCDIKVPTQDIQWSVPEGGGGPKYNLT